MAELEQTVLIDIQTNAGRAEKEMQALNKEIEQTTEAIKATKKAITSFKMQGLSTEKSRAQLSEQQAALKELKSDYKALAPVLEEYKLAEQQMYDVMATGALLVQDSTATMRQLKDTLRDLGTIRNILPVDSKELKEVNTVMGNIQAKLAEIETAGGSFGRVVGNYQRALGGVDLKEFGINAKNSNQALRLMKDEMVKATAEFGRGSEEATKATEAYGKMVTSIERISNEARAMGDFGVQVRSLSNMFNSLNTSILSVATVFGEEIKQSESAQKAIKALTGTIAALNAINALWEVYEKRRQIAMIASNAMQRLKSLLTVRDTAATAANTAATGVQTGVTKVATVAQHGLNTAMRANPAGILLVALGALAGVMMMFGGKTKDSNEELKVQNKILTEEQQITEDLIQKYAQLGRTNKARVVSAKEALEIAKQELKAFEDKEGLELNMLRLAKAINKEKGITVKYTKEEIERFDELEKREKDRKDAITGASTAVEEEQKAIDKAASDRAKDAANAAYESAKTRLDLIEKERVANLELNQAKTGIKETDFEIYKYQQAQLDLSLKYGKITKDNHAAESRIIALNKELALQKQVNTELDKAKQAEDKAKQAAIDRSRDLSALIERTQREIIKDLEIQRDEAIKHYQTLNRSEEEFNDYKKRLTEQTAEKIAKINEQIVADEKAKADETVAHLKKRVQDIEDAFNGLSQGSIDLTPFTNINVAIKQLELLAEEGKTTAEDINKAVTSIATSFTSLIGSLSGSLRELSANAVEGIQGQATDEINNLKTALDAGLIAKEDYEKGVAGIEARRDKAVKEEEIKTAKRQKVLALTQVGIDTAASVVKTGSQLGYPAAIPFQSIAAAIGLAQAAIIASKNIPKFEKGGIIKGKSHAQGGVPINAEGGEYMVNKHSTAKFRDLLEAINRPSPTGIGFISRITTNTPADTAPIIVTVEDINRVSKMHDQNLRVNVL